MTRQSLTPTSPEHCAITLRLACIPKVVILNLLAVNIERVGECQYVRIIGVKKMSEQCECGCDNEHHKYTLDGWACINCECYCLNPPEEGE